MKYITTFIMFISSLVIYADSGLLLKEISFECENSDLCRSRKTRFMNLRGEYRSITHLKETLRIMASDGGYKSFSYTIDEKESNLSLVIRIKLKPIVSKVNIGFLDRSIEIDPAQLISIKEGDFFESERLDQDVKLIKYKLESLGFPESSHQLQLTESKNKISVNIGIHVGQPRVFREISTDTKSSYVRSFLIKKFNGLYNKPFDLTKFKMALDEAQKELFSYGYYLIDLDFEPTFINKRVSLNIRVLNDKLFALNFVNLQIENRETLHSMIRDIFRKYKRSVPESTLKTALVEHFRKKALLNTEITIEISQFTNMYYEPVTLYTFKIQEKSKTRIKSLSFGGNSFFTREEIIKLYEKEAYELASLGFYDEGYITYFTDLLKSKYIEAGFVQSRIIGPTITFDPLKSTALVEYVIQEGQRAFVRSIDFEGVPIELEGIVLEKIYHKTGNHFNPVKVAEDIKTVVNTIQESGYYFAEITNTNDDDFVRYSSSGADVDLKFRIKSGPLVRLNRVIYLGNNKTRKKVLEKKNNLEKGDLITPSKARDFESALSSTGLFSSVSVQPLKHNSKNAMTDLIVKLNEREFGLIEFAPGYRTDIGVKFSGTLSYMNIGGMNRSLALRGQVNQRLNFQTFDERRKKERRQLLEFNSSLNYNQGDIFNSTFDLGMGLSFQRKRFFSFDADIARYNATLSRDLTKKISSSVRYQLENISQSDGTEARDNGTFRIGSITPSMSWDLRNSQVNPVKGAFFNMSCEFANPYFLSQKTDDLTINYYKLISRNRFYIPFSNGTLAISLVAGVQENLAKDVIKDNSGEVIIDEDGEPKTEGYIPNIKIFRLTGMDIVRGFNDEEINRLPSGLDVGTARVTNKAFLTNFKLEPRYFINDALMGGVFFDAGQVSVNQVDIGEIRTSAGLTFKILTPVGTLDFDYGVKLDRKRAGPDKQLEDAGRFHLSIGFF